MINKLADELKELRLAKGLTLQQVAVKTKLDYKFLEAMESGDYEFLPELYVKAFFKEYIKVLGVDEKIYLKKYEAAKQGKVYDEAPVSPETDSLKPSKEPETVPEQKKLTSFDAVRQYKKLEEESSASRKRKKQLFFYIAAGSVFLAVLVYLFIFSESNEIVVPEKTWDEVVEDKPEQTETVKNVVVDDSTAISDSLRLTIRASDTSWIKIVFDDTKSEEFILLPQSQKSMKALNNYKIVFGNASAVHLDLNGKALGYQGKRGAVEKIQIDSSGFKTLALEQAQ